MSAYEEEIARGLYGLQDMIQNQSKTASTPVSVMRTMPRQSAFNAGISDGTVVKFGMILAFMVVAYMMIKGSASYSHQGRRN